LHRLPFFRLSKLEEGVDNMENKKLLPPAQKEKEVKAPMEIDLEDLLYPDPSFISDR